MSTTMELHKVRAPVYGESFGKMEKGYAGKEATETTPQIGMWQFPPRPPARPFYTLITSGMSDRRMLLPQAAIERHYRYRMEICIYVQQPKREHFLALSIAARFPFENNTFLAPGHTIECPESLFPGSQLSAFMFMSLDWCADGDVGKKLVVQGDPVNLLWLVPITAAELALKRARGIEALLQVFEKNNHPLPLNEQRRSYV